MQKDLLSNKTILLSICFSIYMPYTRNGLKKHKMRKHFELILDSTDNYLKLVYNS